MELGTIRFNWHYVIWFRNVTMIMVSLLLPLGLMTHWNLKTLSIIRRQRRLKNRRRRNLIPGCDKNSERDISLHTDNLNDIDVTPQTALRVLNYGAIATEPSRNSLSDIGTLLFYKFAS